MAIKRAQIEQYNSSVISMYENTQNDLIAEICKHFRADKPPSAMDEWRFQRLGEMGGLTQNAVKIIAKGTGAAPAEILKAAKAVGVKAVESDEAKYKKARTAGYFKTTPVPVTASSAFQNIIKNTVKNATGYLNATNTTALQSTKKAFTDIINKTYLEVSTGISTYNEAVAKATRELADNGITGATYVSKAGRTTRSQMDVAVRRMVTTSNTQLAGDVQINRANEWGSNFVETSSHMGARPTHAAWQGKTFMLSGSGYGPDGKFYPNFAEVTGYGTGAGIKGYNCSHDFYPFFPGLSEQAFPHINEKENAAAYDAQQTQRSLENDIRKQKRRAVAAKAVGDTDGETAARVKLGNLQKTLREHVAKNDLYRDPARESIGVKVTALKPPTGAQEPPKAPPAPVVHEVTPTSQKYAPDASAIGRAFSALPDAERMAVSLIGNAPENARAAWNTTAPIVNYETITAPNGEAWYRPTNTSLHINSASIAKGSAVHPAYATFYHEMGHAIDHHAGSNWEPLNYHYISVDFENGIFGRTLHEEADEFVKSFMDADTKIMAARKKASDFLTAQDMHEYGDISDIMQMATSDRVHGQVGHWQKVKYMGRYVSYWNVPGSLEREAFAEMYSSIVANPAGLAKLQKHFPRSLAVFGRMLDTIQKGATL